MIKCAPCCAGTVDAQKFTDKFVWKTKTQEEKKKQERTNLILHRKKALFDDICRRVGARGPSRSGSRPTNLPTVRDTRKQNRY